MSLSDEINILSLSEDFVQLPAIKAATTSTIDFDGLLQTPLRLHEDLKEGCGGQLWPAGIVLAKYMLRRHQETVRGKTVLELGAGGGLTGLAVAAGTTGYQKPLWITDQTPMLPLMHRNIELNSLDGSVEAAVYDWGVPTPATLPARPDIILAADCVYFEPAFPLLQKTLDDLIGDNSVCYFCFKRRRRADWHFVKKVKKMFTVKEVNDDPDKSVYAKENIFLYEIRRKSAIT